MTQRWPIHPKPQEGEILSSWIRRLSLEYGMSSHEILTFHLNWNDDERKIDYNPPMDWLINLASKTNVNVSNLRNMTYSSLIPWVFDGFEDKSDNFRLYISDDILIKDSQYRFNSYSWTAWHNWESTSLGEKVCPHCMKEKPTVFKLMWNLPCILTCDKHKCLLRQAHVFDHGYRLTHDDEDIFITKSLIKMDQHSWQAVKTGKVQLRHKIIGVATWFRVLRSIVNEISMSQTTLSVLQKNNLKKIWARTGYSYRHGVKFWKPFEVLPYNTQTKYLLAAATAIDMLESREITIKTKGCFSHLFDLSNYTPVHDGIRQIPSFGDMNILFERLMQQAKTDRNLAIEMYYFLLMGKKDDDAFCQTKLLLLNQYRIPKRFLSHIDRLIPFYRTQY